MQKWEIAGISVLPVIELAMALNDYLAGAGLGDGVLLVPEAIVLRVFAVIATSAAIVRALRDRKAAK